MHVPINVKSPNNISEWQMEFNSAFKGLIKHERNNKIKTSNYKDAHAGKQSNSVTSTIITIVINIITAVQRLKCNLYNLQELSSLIMSIFILILFFIMNLLT